MANLDEFTECTAVADSTCSVCEEEHTGTLGFTSQSQDKENEEDEDISYDVHLCKECLFTETEGRFKNKNIQQVVREFEEVRFIETDEEDNIVINTTSVLGELVHIHYTTETNQVKQEQNQQAVIVTVLELTGTSEIFNSSGEFVAQPSPYVDVAEKVISQHNEQRVKNL